MSKYSVYNVYTTYNEREYDHGTIEAKKVNEQEKELTVNVLLVVSYNDVDSFAKELQELLQKYAL